MTTLKPSYRRRLFCACAAASLALAAKGQTVPAENQAANGEPLVLSNFSVTTTQDKGYVTTNAATGFKTRQELLNIPQAIMVMTRDLIDDIGGVRTSDILQYAGAANFYRGESVSVRGSRINNPLLDEMPDNVPIMDNIFVDTYELIKGPASVLYANATIGGVVLKTSRKALYQRRNSVTASINDDGLYRVEVDSGGPLGNLGDGKFAYRVIGMVQGGEYFLRNTKDDRLAIHPSLGLNYKNTTVYLGLDYQEQTHIPNGNNVLTSDGKLYTGAGRDEGYYAPGTMEDFKFTGARLQILQRISDNWEAKLQARQYSFHRLGGIVFPSGGVNWQTNTITFTARRNNQEYDNYYLTGDVSGNYTIAGLKNQTMSGFTLGDETAYSRFWASPTFGSVTRPVNAPNMDTIVAPRADQYTQPANPGSRVKGNFFNSYFQQNITIIPDRLSLVGAVSWYNLEQNNVANLGVRPLAGTVITVSKPLHRYGATFNITKDIVVYALESTTVLAPGTARTITGGFLPPQEGKGQEVGLKTSLLNGRISSTFSVFKQELTNQSVFAGVDANGVSYAAPIGSTTQKGWDMDISLKLTDAWQVIGTYFDGEVYDQNNAAVANTYGRSMSLFSRYDFKGGALDGFAFGGGFVRISDRKVTSAGIVFPVGQTAPALITMEPGNWVDLFASYRLNRNWSFRLACANVLDEAYAMGAQTAYFVDPSPPRTFTFQTSYKF